MEQQVELTRRARRIYEQLKAAIAQHRSAQGVSCCYESCTDPNSKEREKVHMPNRQLPRLTLNDERLQEKDVFFLSDFMGFHDEAFVVNAYRGLLRREPEPDGLQHYLSAIRNGRLTKIEVLGRLRYSTEGKINRIKLRGLIFAFALQTAFRIPVVGYALAWLTSILRLPILIKNLERTIIDTMRSEKEHRNAFNDLSLSLESELTDIRSMLANQLQFSHQQIDRIEALSIQKVNREELSSKVDRGEFMDLAKSKADRSELESLMEAKADREELNCKVDHGKFIELEQTKADRSELVEILKQILDHRRNIVDQQRRLMVLMEEIRRRLGEPLSEESTKQVLNEDDHLLDALYATFEDRFRGTREDIKERQRIYLPYIHEAGAGELQTRVVDLGCGRGEWLELLRESGVNAEGVDINRVFLKWCRELGLSVVESDALAYLRSLSANSVGALTAFHLIEHLPLKTLVALLDETLRVLKPGGVMILETPNPENIIVASCNFYVDPTHRNPLPPQTTQYLVEARGYTKTEILRLHRSVAECCPGLKVPDLNEGLRNLLCAAQDYAVIARK